MNNNSNCGCTNKPLVCPPIYTCYGPTGPTE